MRKPALRFKRSSPGYTAQRTVALLIVLLGLSCASRKPAQLPGDIYASFYKAHPVMTCSVKVIQDGKRVSAGWLQFERPEPDQPASSQDISAAYYLDAPGDRWSFVHSQGISLETYLDEKVYDRLTDPNFAVPEARKSGGGAAYPASLVYGSVGPGFNGKSKIVTKDLGSGQTEYTTEYDSPEGTIDRRVVLDQDGALLAMEGKQGSAKTWNGYEFSDYTFTASKVAKYDTNPPIGYQQFGFDKQIHVLSTGTAIPDVSIRVKGESVLAQNFLDGPWVLAVIARSSLPAGLSETLKKLPHEVAVVFITQEPVKETEGYHSAIASQGALDALGTAAFPQFYLVKSGKVAQAWEGWHPGQEPEFLTQLNKVMSGGHYESP